MQHRIGAIVLAALLLAPGVSFAQSIGDGTSKPVNPGDVRITTRAPESDKWNAAKSANGAQRVFRCKPLACADAQTVSFTFSKSPTLKPNPEALEKFAKTDLPKSIRAASAAREVMSDAAEKIETLLAETATMKGYPSVLNESKFTRNDKATYLETAIIFAGPVMVRVESSSPSQELAKKALTDFIEVMRIEEGPPKPRPGTPRTQSL
jgi:hypothetical protein